MKNYNEIIKKLDSMPGQVAKLLANDLRYAQTRKSGFLLERSILSEHDRILYNMLEDAHKILTKHKVIVRNHQNPYIVEEFSQKVEDGIKALTVMQEAKVLPSAVDWLKDPLEELNLGWPSLLG